MKKTGILIALALLVCSLPAGPRAAAEEGCDHAAAVWETVTEPTCTEPGERSAVCPTCGETLKEPLPALRHSYAPERTEPTCTRPGLIRNVCTRCGVSYDLEELPETGHSYGGWTVTKPATWRDEGAEKRTCLTCGDAETRALPRRAHLPDAACPKGDADMDGTVTSADARLILRLSVSFDDGLDALQTKKADFDGKNGVTSADARYALRVSVGLSAYGPDLLAGYTFAGYTSRGYVLAKKDGLTYVVSSYGYTLIANKTYSVPASYAPGDLTPECRAAFNEMASAAAKDGVSLYIVSGYRSYATQQGLYSRYAAKDGYAAADTYSARPGHSEHQTGLAMDLNSLSASFAYTKEGRWLAANAYKYGFIIRYPYSKQSVTGYVYEPWHVRYLGRSLAAAVYNSGLCLEEFFGITSRY